MIFWKNSNYRRGVINPAHQFLFFFFFLERGGGINGLSMILCLWSPLHPLSKLLAMQDHTQNLEEQLWMGGRREVSFIFYRPVTRSDLKQERAFFRGSVSTFLQLVVATACPNGKLLNWLSFHPGGNCLLNFLSSFHWPNPPPPPPFTPSKHFTWSRAALSSLSQVLPGYTRKNLAQYLDFTASIFFLYPKTSTPIPCQSDLKIFLKE